jgi:hypothetical protein
VAGAVVGGAVVAGAVTDEAVVEGGGAAGTADEVVVARAGAPVGFGPLVGDAAAATVAGTLLRAFGRPPLAGASRE